MKTKRKMLPMPVKGSSELRLERARKRARQFSEQLHADRRLFDRFEKNPKQALEDYGMQAVDLTLRAPDGCYYCNTTTCSGRTCLKTC